MSSVLTFLDRDRTIAPPGYNRWLVPPAALAIHLSIGQAYAFSVFNLPLSRSLGVTASAPGDWSLSTIGWVFSAAIVMLGLSAALFGAWLERAGPRKAMFASACCFAAGFFVGALGVSTHQFWLLLLGYGVIGGTGLGLGYISPVSTLINWFPDRPGMATGLAIMGFGGGAMIASPLSVTLMNHFKSATSTGVAPTFVTLGVLYLVFMMFGVFTVRVPATGWAPATAARGVPETAGSTSTMTAAWAAARPAAPRPTVPDVPVAAAVRTPQFWLLWVMLLVNVTAGIAVLSQASPMIQEMFSGRIGAEAAAAFVGLLSLANLVGRFFWASFSDRIGRRATFATFFTLGAVLYALVPTLGRSGGVALFVGACVVILSMYGGGFATIPAYLRDLFGTGQVGAIHGRLLTAWSTAGVLGPVLVNYVRDYRLAHGVPSAEAYSTTMYVVTGLLLVGLVASLRVRALASVPRGGAGISGGTAPLAARPMERAS
ncbi:MAG TPA: OFA family MFS transporter [Gemmatirosa sp.]